VNKHYNTHAHTHTHTHTHTHAENNNEPNVNMLQQIHTRTRTHAGIHTKFDTHNYTRNGIWPRNTTGTQMKNTINSLSNPTWTSCVHCPEARVALPERTRTVAGVSVRVCGGDPGSRGTDKFYPGYEKVLVTGTGATFIFARPLVVILVLSVFLGRHLLKVR
jgi:hypothetical protein